MAVDYPVPDHTKAEVELLSSVRSLKVDYFETITGTRVVSDAFKTLLEQFQSNVQFIPATVCYHDTRPVEKTYWIAHLPIPVDGFDYERSEYGRKTVIAASVHQPPRKPVKVFSKLVLDADKIDGHHFFKLAHVITLKPIISSELYENMQEA
ncbi:imm11 family protein [Paenibacillus amylolyticus]|uniref:imm11 family protein n=1 Tax=Paenibacillus amylolyticus TaxID=1451 RepID=UPI003EBE44CB